MPDSATRTTSAGHGGADPHGAVGVDLEGDEVALVDADQRGADGDGPLQLGFVVDLDEHVEARARRRGRGGRRSSASSRAATMRSTASAPMSAGVGHVAGVDGEVLAQHRDRARRPEPPGGRRPSRRTTSSSVSTERQAAPPAVVGRRPSPAGSRSAARSPFDGDRRFTSAMTASSSAAAARSAAVEAAGRRGLARAASSERLERPRVGRRGGAVGLEDAVEVGGHGARRLRAGRWAACSGVSRWISGGSASRPPIAAEGLGQGRVLAVGVEGGLVGVELVEPERAAVALAVEDVLDRAGLGRRRVDERPQGRLDLVGALGAGGDAGDERDLVRHGRRPYRLPSDGRSAVPRRELSSATNGATRNIAHDSDEQRHGDRRAPTSTRTASPSTPTAIDSANTATGSRETQPRQHDPAAERRVVGQVGQQVLLVGARRAGRAPAAAAGVRRPQACGRSAARRPGSLSVAHASFTARIVSASPPVPVGVVLPGQRHVRLADLRGRRRRRHPEHLVEGHRIGQGSARWRGAARAVGTVELDRGAGLDRAGERRQRDRRRAPAERAEDVTAPTSAPSTVHGGADGHRRRRRRSRPRSGRGTLPPRLSMRATSSWPV